MEDKKTIKMNLSTFFLILALIVIIVMGGFIYKLYNDKEITNINVAERNSQTHNSDNLIINTSQPTEQNLSEIKTYNHNFSDSVFKGLDDNAKIVIPIWAYCNYSEITINSKHEAYWHNEGNDTFAETDNSKVADNVINAWYCPLGQDIESNACLLFLKEDGRVTYIRFYIDKDQKGNEFVNATNEQILKEISGISNVLTVENEFYGVMFIKEDGTAISLPLTKLDDLTAVK